MASANTPILNKILKELTDFKREMYEFKEEMLDFKKDMVDFKKEMYEFRDNVVYDKKYISMSQEKSDAEYFRNYMEMYHPSLTIELWPFGDFYDKSGKIITDIDGCITANTIPIQPLIIPGLKNNSHQIKNIRNVIFFIESKNLLDKVNFDVKIVQYNKILINIKASRTANNNNASDNYKSMIDSYPLKYKPSEIYFILSATDISLPLRLFIQSINNKELTEELYKIYVSKMFMEHSLYKRIRKDIKSKPTLIKKYDSTKTFDGFIELFKDPIFIYYSEYLKSFFITFTEVKDLYSNMEGLLGYIFHGNVYMPNPFRN